jgi:hypothetical protein
MMDVCMGKFESKSRSYLGGELKVIFMKVAWGI